MLKITTCKINIIPCLDMYEFIKAGYFNYSDNFKEMFLGK